MTSMPRSGSQQPPIEPPGAGPIDRLVPDAIAADEFGVTGMTLWRWDNKPEGAAMRALGWPPPVIYKRRKFRSRRQLETFKQNLLQRAIHERGQKRPKL